MKISEREKMFGAIAADLPLRHEKARRILRENGVDAAVITGNTNLIYLAGGMVDGYLYLPSQGDPKLFIRSGDPVFNGEIVKISRPEMIPQVLGGVGEKLPRRLTIEYEEISHKEWLRISQLFFDVEVVDINLMRKVRSVKTDYEIEMIREGGKIHAGVYGRIPGHFRKGMTDVELSAAIEHDMRTHGHLGLFRTHGFRMEAHMGSLIAGDNAGAPSPYDFALGGAGMHPAFPLGSDGKEIQEGVTVMSDLSGNYNGYMIDLSRTFSVGKLPQRAYDLHDIALEILSETAAMLKPGVMCSELYECAQKIVTKYHAEECFMGHSKQAKFIGHGVGMEINELPIITGKYKQELTPNMVIALEPKFVLPGVGALGAENTYIVTKNEAINTTQCEEKIIDLLN